MPRPPGPGRGNRVPQGNGAGWGGPAKGSGSEKVARPHGRVGRAIQIATPVEAKAERAERRAATRDEVMGVYEEIMRDSKAPAMARLAAASHWQDRSEGKPAQTNVNLNTDLVEGFTREQQRTLLDAVRTQLAAVEDAGDDAPKVTH